jgi:hypothetical protein
MKTRKKAFVITGTLSFSRGKTVEMNPVQERYSLTEMIAELPSLYCFTNLDGSIGGCFRAAGNHFAVLIHFNYKHIS